jgi:hypothetical protein
MATAEVELVNLAVVEAIAAARRRWVAIQAAPATLLAGEDDLHAARAVAAELQDLIADVRQVDGLTSPGWAVAWPLQPSSSPPNDQEAETIASRQARPGAGPADDPGWTVGFVPLPT